MPLTLGPVQSDFAQQRHVGKGGNRDCWERFAFRGFPSYAKVYGEHTRFTLIVVMTISLPRPISTLRRYKESLRRNASGSNHLRVQRASALASAILSDLRPFFFSSSKMKKDLKAESLRAGFENRGMNMKRN